MSKLTSAPETYLTFFIETHLHFPLHQTSLFIYEFETYQAFVYYCAINITIGFPNLSLCVFAGSGISGMNSMTGGMGMGMGMDRMNSTFDRMGPTMGTGLERNIDMDRGFVPGPMGSGVRDRVGSKGNQIFVRNVST